MMNSKEIKAIFVLIIVLGLIFVIPFELRAKEEKQTQSSRELIKDKNLAEVDWEYIFNVVLALISLILMIVVITKLDFLKK